MTLMFVFDAVLVAAVAFGFPAHLLGLAVLAVLLGLLMITTAAFSIATALITKEISGFAATSSTASTCRCCCLPACCCRSRSVRCGCALAPPSPADYLVAASRPLADVVLRARGVAGVRGAGAPVRTRARMGDERLPQGGRVTRRASACVIPTVVGHAGAVDSPSGVDQLRSSGQAELVVRHPADGERNVLDGVIEATSGLVGDRRK